MAETARTRLSRALNTKTGIAGERLNLRAGDRVDYFRDDGPKDKGKWIGPCTVIDVQGIARGNITIKHAQRPTVARLQDVRHHMEFLVFLASERSPFGSAVRALAEVKHAIEQLDPGQMRTIHGANIADCDRPLFEAVSHLARRGMQLPPVLALRIGLGVSMFHPMRHCCVSYTLVWRPGKS